jgi:hypothetical protein
MALFESGMEIASIKHMMMFLWLMLTTAVFQWWERWATQLVCICTGIEIAAEGLGVGWFTTNMWLDFPESMKSSQYVHILAGVFLAIFGTMILILRWKAVGVSWWSIRKDQKVYDSLWANMMLDPAIVGEMLQLREAVLWVQQSVSPSAVRQRCVVQGAMGITRMEPLTSLDTLYNQAAGAELLLRSKVVHWAGVSKGLFPLQRDQSFDEEQTWIRVNCEDIDSLEMVRWPKIKTPERAIEKLMRSYGGDVSRLLDVSRQAIVFENMQDVKNCFLAICRDPEITIERVKNRYDSSYRSSASAGYRDLNVNLRLISQDAIDHGVTSHVCEVQMILKSFAVLKSAEGHERYVAFRNTRGE